jgi:nitroreductase
MDRRQIILGGGAVAALGLGSTYLTLSGMGSSSDYAADIAPLRAPLPTSPQVRDLIRYATLAPNGHNTQPWRFHVRDNVIRILPDVSRRTPVVDPDDHHLFVSLGCAAENLALASAACGRPGSVTFDPAAGGSAAFVSKAGEASRSALFDAIVKRQSTRLEYDGRQASVADLHALSAAGLRPGVDLVLITDRPQLDRMRDLVVAANSAQLADPAFVRELKHWLRFNPRQAFRTGDGLYSAATGHQALPDWLGPRAFDLTTAKSDNDNYARQIRSSSGIAVFAGGSAGPEQWLDVGRACQRFALQATAMGMKYAFINQPVEVAALRPDLAALIGLPGRRPDIVMRFGYGTAVPFSARRAVDAVIVT